MTDIQRDWIRLSVWENDDGTFEGYEVLTGETRRGTAREVSEWAIRVAEEAQNEMLRSVRK